MRPVEIEFLVKDSTKAGAQRVSASIDRETMKILGRMDRIQAKIDKLKSSNNDALDQDHNIAEIKKLESQLDKLQSKMAKVAAQPSLGPTPSEIEKTARQYNGLNNSIQQIARELPVAAMGPQMFFMAISNNLPIFTDELARARKEYEALVASGQKGVPVWKQILSSIVSWQTALTVGIMLLVTYGDEIANWVTSLVKGKSSLDSASRALDEFHSTMAQGSVNAQKEITSLQLLYRVATDSARSYAERKRAVDELQETYPSYFANLSEEEIMIGNAITAYEKLRDAILQSAEAKAAENRLVNIAENRQILEATESMQRYNASYREMTAARKAYDEAQNRMKGTEGTKAFVQASEDAKRASATYESALGDLRRVQKDVFDELATIEGGEDLVALIKDTYDGDLRKYLDVQNQLREQLIDVAENAYSQDEYKGKKTSVKSTAVDVKGRDLLLQAARDLEDDQNAIIQDGYEKRRAIAKTEFERQLHDIRENRQKLLAQDQKETGGTSSAQINLLFDAQLATAATKYKQALTQIDRDQQAEAAKTYDALLEKYETYLQGRERLSRQYDKDIASLSASPENQMIAEEAKEKALAEFDVAFASQFPQFERWANSIVTQSVDKLRELIALAEHELEAMEADSSADPNALAKARAEIATLRKKLAEAISKKSDEDSGEDSFERWKNLSEVLGEVNDDLQEIGETLGGTVGEIIDVAGTVSTSILSIIGGIKQLVADSANAITTTAGTAEAAIRTIESASVILAIISGALQIVQAIAGLFKNTETSMERNIRLAEEFNEELRVMNERARINKNDDTIFGDAIYENFRNNIAVMRDALRALERDKQAVLMRYDERYYGTTLGLSRPWDSMEDSLANMQVQVRHSTLFRSAKYASLKDLIPELFGDDGRINMDALSEFADESNETFQKLSKQNQDLINSMVSDWEIYEEALESVKDYLSSVFGDLGDTILDSMISVADGTMSAADAMTTRLEALSGTVKEFAKNMIYAMTIGPLLKEAEQAIMNIQAGEGSDEEKYDAMLDVLSQLMTDVDKEQETATMLWNRVKEIAAAQGIDFDQKGVTSQTGKAGAMYTVSQDSFTRAEGILTSIQAHVASGDLKLDNITSQLIQQLDALNAIAANTAPISEIYALLIAIQREGLRVV